jgi:hypothetical protein
MKRMLLLGTVMLLAMPVAAFAQDKPIVAGAGLSPNMTDAPQATTADPAVAPSGMGPGSPAEAAFSATGSDTGVTPGTPDGQKSTIPHSTTTAETPIAPQAATAETTDAARATPAATDGDTLFTSVPSADDLSSSVIGLEIFNKDKANIGTIKDIAFGPDGVRAYIVGVGGFLGIGDRYVAIRPSALKLTYSADDKKWHAEMDTNAVQLTAAPEFKYPTNS